MYVGFGRGARVGQTGRATTCADIISATDFIAGFSAAVIGQKSHREACPLMRPPRSLATASFRQNGVEGRLSHQRNLILADLLKFKICPEVLVWEEKGKM